VRAGVCVAALLPGPRAQRRGKPYYGARCLLLRRRSSASGSPRLVRGGAHLVRAGVVVVRAVLLTPGLSRVFLGLRVHVVGAGVDVQLAERCDRAHEVRLTRPDVVLRRYTQNDGSAQPRRGGDHLAVPTGVNRQLLADPVGLPAVGTTCGPKRAPCPPLSAPSYGRCGRRTGCCTALARGRRASTTTTRPRTSPHTAPATSQVRRSWQRGARLRSIA
jgi:hypothetical protein